MQDSTSGDSKRSSASSQPEGLAVLDAHCHVDLFERPGDVIAEAERLEIRTIAVTNLPSQFEKVSRLVGHRRNVRVAAGLHPQFAVAHRRELELLWRTLPITRYVGEVGLDYAGVEASERGAQREVFEAILQRCEDLGGKVLSVHSRRASGDVLRLASGLKNCAVVLHWFSGTAPQAEQASADGLFFSVNVAMTRGTALDLVARLPRERVLTESDGPFVKWRGRPAEPSSTSEVITALSRLWSVTPSEARGQIVENLKVLLETAGATPASRAGTEAAHPRPDRE